MLAKERRVLTYLEKVLTCDHIKRLIIKEQGLMVSEEMMIRLVFESHKEV